VLRSMAASLSQAERQNRSEAEHGFPDGTRTARAGPGGRRGVPADAETGCKLNHPDPEVLQELIKNTLRQAYAPAQHEEQAGPATSYCKNAEASTARASWNAAQSIVGCTDTTMDGRCPPHIGSSRSESCALYNKQAPRVQP
jgi:hypothetical protein